jgi:uncharacterized membrane protein
MDKAFRPFVTSGIVLGVAVAGFFDGIVFHQLLQWHHMLSATHWSTETVHGLEVNTLADGAFHLACLAVMILGVSLLARDIERVGTRPPRRTLIGALLLGACLFNVAEGIIDHLILGIHHVRAASDQTGWDIGFLVLFSAVGAVGAWLVWTAGEQHAA